MGSKASFSSGWPHNTRSPMNLLKKLKKTIALKSGKRNFAASYDNEIFVTARSENSLFFPSLEGNHADAHQTIREAASSDRISTRSVLISLRIDFPSRVGGGFGNPSYFFFKNASRRRIEIHSRRTYAVLCVKRQSASSSLHQLTSGKNIRSRKTTRKQC